MEKITELNRGSFLRQTATYRQRQETRRQNDEFLKSDNQKPSGGFLENGAHKVYTEIGKKVFDTLANLQRKADPSYKSRPRVWGGVTFEIMTGAGIHTEGYLEKIEPQRDYLASNHTRFQLQDTTKVKLRQALHGGTDERLELLRSLNEGDKDDDSVDSE